MRPHKMRPFKVRPLKACRRKECPHKVRPFKVRPHKECPFKMRLLKVCPFKVCPREVRRHKSALPRCGLLKVRTREMRPREVRPFKVRTREMRPREMRLFKVYLLKVCPFKVRLLKVSVTKIKDDRDILASPFVPRFNAPLQDREVLGIGHEVSLRDWLLFVRCAGLAPRANQCTIDGNLNSRSSICIQLSTQSQRSLKEQRRSGPHAATASQNDSRTADKAHEKSQISPKKCSGPGCLSCGAQHVKRSVKGPFSLGDTSCSRPASPFRRALRRWACPRSAPPAARFRGHKRPRAPSYNGCTC